MEMMESIVVHLLVCSVAISGGDIDTLRDQLPDSLKVWLSCIVVSLLLNVYDFKLMTRSHVMTLP